MSLSTLKSVALPPDAAAAADCPGQAIIFIRRLADQTLTHPTRRTGSHDNAEEPEPLRQRYSMADQQRPSPPGYFWRCRSPRRHWRRAARLEPPLPRPPAAIPAVRLRRPRTP